MQNHNAPLAQGDTTGRPRLIVSSSQAFLQVALRELRRVDPGIRAVEHYGSGVFMTEGSRETREMTRILQASPPVFIKHIMPASVAVALSGDADRDLGAIVRAARAACELAPPARFAVQCRCVSPLLAYRAKDIEVAVGSAFEARGCVPAFSDRSVDGLHPDRIVSVFVSSRQCYIGCSTAEENLNAHCDEYRIRSRTGKEISRAEHKLEEAIRVFGLEVDGGQALDLGASPGGWTRVLARRGMRVVAVDGAAPDQRVLGMPSVITVRCRAEDYHPDRTFDLIVNDMNIEPEASARIMVEMGTSLKPGGRAVMTAKHTAGDPEQRVKQTVAVLREAFHVTAVRHLFHNRREVTICLLKPG